MISKTDAQRSKEYREKKKTKKYNSKIIPKTDAQRSKEYRERQKAKKNNQGENVDRPRKSKTPAEYMREYRRKKKLNNQITQLNILLAENYPIDKQYSAQGNLNAHLKIHTGQKDHVCSVCNRSFITSIELIQHMAQHRDLKRFKCDRCESAYRYERGLKLHKKNKHQMAQVQKLQNFNGAGNIEIIGVDGNDAPKSMKEATQLIPHLRCEKTTPVSKTPLIPNDQQKDVFAQNTRSSNSLHSCAICSEGFNNVIELSQHYALRHEDLNSFAKHFMA